MAGSSASANTATSAIWIFSLVMVMLGVFMRLVSIQKISFFLLFFEFIRALGIQRLHFPFFFRRQLRQVADEADELPRILLVVIGSAAPSGHAGHSNAVLDDEKQLAIGHL